MRSVFIVVSTLPKVDFILHSGLLTALRNGGLEPVIISPFCEDDSFRREFGGKNRLERLYPLSRAARIINNFRQRALRINNRRLVEAANISSWLHRNTITSEVSRSIFIKDFILKFLPNRLKWSPVFWDFLERALIKNARYDALFQKYKPAAVVLDDPNSEFVTYSLRYKTPTFFIDMNFDALLARFTSIFRPINRVGILGEVQKEEAVNVHNLTPEKLVVVGSIRYDRFFNPDYNFGSRENFFREIGVDFRKKLIYFNTVDPRWGAGNEEIIRAVLRAINGGLLRFPAQLAVSVLDSDNTPYADLFHNEKNLVLIKDGRGQFPDFSTKIAKHSDAVIGIGSSSALEALLAGTPAIWVGFGEAGKIYQLEYLRKIIDFGAVLLATDEAELVYRLNSCLRDKSLNNGVRKEFLRKWFYKTDGKAAERVARVVLELAPARHASRASSSCWRCGRG